MPQAPMPIVQFSPLSINPKPARLLMFGVGISRLRAVEQVEGFYPEYEALMFGQLILFDTGR